MAHGSFWLQGTQRHDLSCPEELVNFSKITKSLEVQPAPDVGPPVACNKIDPLRYGKKTVELDFLFFKTKN